MEILSLLRCDTYEYDKVKVAIDDTFKQLGGIEKYIKPGMKVLLKINLLMKKRPEEATTTHPVFVEALVRAIQSAGGIVVIGDSPGGPYTVNALRGVYRACGIEQVAKNTGALLNYDISVKEVSFEKGRITKRFTVINPVFDTDFIITVPKLKTHGMTMFTGAVKNLFGVIPGINKAEYHFRMADKKDFCEMLVDLCEYVKPGLAIMDGIIGMEGSGPSGGSPRQIGAVIASENPYLVDLAAINIIGLKTNEVYTVYNSIARGLCPAQLEDVTMVGQAISEFVIADYKLPSGRGISFVDRLPAKMQRKINGWVSPNPIFIHETCVGCKDCAKACPPRAIEMKQQKPYVDMDKCIKCFCCQELCPKKAVEIKRPWWLRKILQ